MNTAITILGILLVVILLATVGCAANQPYRTNFNSTGGDKTKAVIESTDEYKLGFVEFDDQGWYWDICQRETVEQMIEEEAGFGQQGTPRGIVLVAFVHGWKDNADYNDYAVVAFRQILSQLNQAELTLEKLGKRPARKVVGVYAGWRGLSAKWEPFKELSFWDRKDTAHKVGGYGAMTKLLADLENIQKKGIDKVPPNQPQTELIIIGHSLGAGAVYSALSQIIVERFADAQDKDKLLKPLGDQVILLNPAFEAGRHYDLNQLALAMRGKYHKEQRPVLSIFTSQDDWATHFAFPAGRFLSTLFDSNRSAEQKQTGRQAVGWYGPFITHHLIYTANKSAPTTQTTTLNPKTNHHEYHTADKLKMSVQHVDAEKTKWKPNNPDGPQTYTFDDCTLQPNSNYPPGDPFLIVSVDKGIMKNHDDISDKVLINFLRQYIQFCHVEAKNHSK